MRTLHVTFHESQQKTVSDLLKTIPSVEISEENERHIIPSNAQTGEKPSDYSGPWKGDKRDFQEIRRTAWTRKR